VSTEHSVDLTPSVPFSTLPLLLQHQANRIPDAPAILAPARAALSYGRLYRHIDQMRCTLRAMGVGPHDRIALVLPNGPEMAVAILTVAASAVCAPINPGYRSEEVDRYFSDLRPCALITERSVDSPARRAALSRGVRILELSTAVDSEAGLFSLTGDSGDDRSNEPIGPEDVALLLLTSGTTSRPKIVPLTHANICMSAHSWGVALSLKEADCCLNMMPLFYGHITSNVLASLSAGASVVCTSGCDLKSLFAWLNTFRPTWYPAVPTIHQAILAEARLQQEQIPKLRFIRSSSAPMPARLLADLEQTFEAPVIESYGMTETASAPIACNPLPPGRRKPGSVGVPVGLDVAIMDEAGTFLPAGQTGQIAVCGASVMSGYEGKARTSEAAFVGNWFKTGDHGFFDDDGYLFLVGRKQEVINRGGEKVAPREVDEVLLSHPAIVEAVTFAMPHPTLGEDVASAVVLRADAAVTPNDIRRFIIGRVADFKVPQQVLIVDELPQGPTGKVQRVGLAAKLGLTDPAAMAPSYVAPRTPIEAMLTTCWAEILQLERVGIHDDFFALGGDSLSVAHVIARVYEITHLEIDASHLFQAPTIAEVARHIEALIQAGERKQPASGLVRAPRDGPVPASMAQERLWELQQALPGIPLFNVLYALRLTSAFDRAILERSVNEIVRRHEILRTSFAVVDGQSVQIIAPQLTVHLTFDDLHALPASEKETIGHRVIQEEVLHCFDLPHGPLFRVRLVCVAEQEYLLLITMHQIIGDGWSAGVLAEDLAAVYDALFIQATPSLVPLVIQYADFAYWQRHWQSHPDLVAQLAYWRDQLRDPLPENDLVAVRPRQTIDDFRTAQRMVTLPAFLSEASERFARQQGGTLFMVLIAALMTLLRLYLRQDDVRVATLVANRNRAGTERLVGPLVNAVIFRTDLGGDPSLREVMRRVRATTLAAFANQDLPFEVLVETLERERGLTPANLARVMIQLQNATLRPMVSLGHSLAFEEANPDILGPLVTPMTFDVSMVLREGTDRITGSCVYKPDLFDSTMIGRLLRDFQSTLEQMVAQPDRPISSIRVSLSEKIER
jgi:acyl-CoA synthetase (AMP-forming)/AMP-acid ligase II